MRYIQDYKDIVKLGVPILVGQLGMVAVGFADNIMVGNYSTDALASASLVNNVFNVIIFCCIGFTYGLLPLAGALFGNGKYREVGTLMRNATALNVIFALALTALMALLYFNLDILDQPQELMPLIRPYYVLYLYGIVPVSLFNVFAQWSYAIKNTVMPMWIVLGTNVANVVGNYALIYGHFGLPELGLYGAGLSTLTARIAGPVIIIAIFMLSRRYREYRKGFISGRITASHMRKVWDTSLPVSMQMTFESGSFSIAAIMAGWLGAVALASYQIIVIIGTLGFCLYYAIGSAIAVLVSNEAGKDDVSGMRRVAWAGYHVMLALATVSTLIFVFGARQLMHLFTSDIEVLSTTLTLIVPLALYQLGDATQVTFANALRGTSHVMPMLWIAFFSYMIVGVPATYLLAFTAGLGIYGIILSFSVSLFLAGALFLRSFLRVKVKSPSRRSPEGGVDFKFKQ